MIGHQMADCFDLAAWVASSCEAQGVPVKVTDPVLVRQVCVLLVATESGPRLGRQPVRGPARRRSEPPDRSYSLRVEASAGALRRVDDGMVENGGNNSVLPGEREIGPLSA